MKTVKIWNDNPSADQLREVAAALRRGDIVIIPTDSTYAIACNALDSKAIADLCRIKGINPDKNQLSILCSHISMASEYAHIDNAGFSILKQFTPGPFTFLFRAARTLPKVFKGRKTVGIRIPDNATARGIVAELGNPILTTSIEFEDDDHAREPELIEENYDKFGVSLIVDAGEGDSQYTTIVDCSEGTDCEILRQGKGSF